MAESTSVSTLYATGKQSVLREEFLTATEVLTHVLGFGDLWFKTTTFSGSQMGISLQVLEVL